jgi:hypothetical protein
MSELPKDHEFNFIWPRLSADGHYDVQWKAG